MDMEFVNLHHTVHFSKQYFLCVSHRAKFLQESVLYFIIATLDLSIVI